MAPRPLGLPDVQHGRVHSRSRLLAPLRYLLISHPEKSKYDFLFPAALAIIVWVGDIVLGRPLEIFGDAGVLRFARDLLIMAVPFMIGALASVAMGLPGPYMDKRPVGAEIFLGGEQLTLRQFVCYMLGYLSFVGLSTLIATIIAQMLHKPVVAFLCASETSSKALIYDAGLLILFLMLSVLCVTTFWALYFLTEVVNRQASNI